MKQLNQLLTINLLYLEIVQRFSTCILSTLCGSLAGPHCFPTQVSHMPLPLYHMHVTFLVFSLHFLLSCLSPRSYHLALPGAVAGRDWSLLKLYPIGGAFHGSFSSVTLPFSPPPSWLPGPRNGYLLCCHSWVLTEYYVNLRLSLCSCHTPQRKRNPRASDACPSGLPFPLRTLKCGVRLTASKLLEQLGVIFEVGDLKNQQAQLSRTFLRVGLYKRSKVKGLLGSLSLLPREVS